MERVTDVLFGDSDFSKLSGADLKVLSAEIFTVPIGKSLIEALVQAGLASSNGEAKRLIASGAIAINGQKVSADRPLNTVSLIKKGKNNFVLAR